MAFTLTATHLLSNNISFTLNEYFDLFKSNVQVLFLQVLMGFTEWRYFLISRTYIHNLKLMTRVMNSKAHDCLG